ncbi:bifunctional 4-hydroxy-2-oxoglutarate aldolase/2-dehydro-3-deoxy-phosphogluconate aldolase [Thermus tenuipuniceus]|uniref:bifunctional 4-hydroxy-2-oxoglutarate aldolase/2-dehydro-3-deoxy-phosphogluconate aldolase n=1 Tax=Thermus tenuipuniceus TaxID=2078690 RepID=UPI000CF9C4E9|nr:bifunctional 4-hydroxy-2-oxoglutarate aldolase/2-dehydro-3-deoxy-phosphogluconate aldolase [Thermus tenuipuniceus]
MQNPLELLTSYRFLPILTVRTHEELQHLEHLITTLKEEDLPIIEVTLRTPLGLQALTRINASGLCVGAGTVRNAEHAREALASGAAFLVSPAYREDVALFAREHGLLYLPGVLTPLEVEQALDRGLSILKFFPAEPFQGVKVLAHYAKIFPEAQFIPTGGIDEKNVSIYCSLPNVIACGGSWLIKGGFEAVSRNIRNAKALVSPQARD